MYKTTDLAKIFKVSLETIKNWTKKYNIPCERTLGGHLRYSDESIEYINNLLREKYNLK